jgi:hypothetical protein
VTSAHGTRTSPETPRRQREDFEKRRLPEEPRVATEAGHQEQGIEQTVLVVGHQHRRLILREADCDVDLILEKYTRINIPANAAMTRSATRRPP